MTVLLRALRALFPLLRLPPWVLWASSQATSANANLAQRMLETFDAMWLIRAFGRENYERDRFNAASQEVSKIFFKVDRISGAVHPLSEVLVAPLLLGILVVMAMRSPGQMALSVTFLILLYRLHPRIKQFDADRIALDALSASVEEIRSLLDETDKPYLLGGSRVPTSIEHEIVFENVSFHYDSGKTAALERVTCSINMVGETTAFVGRHFIAN